MSYIGCHFIEDFSRYLSLNIEQLFEVFLGMDEQAEIINNKIKKNIFLLKIT